MRRYQSPRRRARETWDTRLGVFSEQYKSYCESEEGLYLAQSNIRNHMMVLRRMTAANPQAEYVTEIFTPASIDAMLTGKGNTSLQNSTRYDYLLIVKVTILVF